MKSTKYVTFVDFTHAYDLVPRDILFGVLKRLGCGAVMLAAIIAMYSETQSVLGTVVIATTMGVRQRSPTSSILFIIFVNDLIKLIRETCEPDGFLSWLHLLVMMDDTVQLSTTRPAMIRKLTLFADFCNHYGMRHYACQLHINYMRHGAGQGKSGRGRFGCQTLLPVLISHGPIHNRWISAFGSQSLRADENVTI